MATRYSDVVTLRESLPAYNIENEPFGAWKSFIANKQFNEILHKVVQSVRNNDPDNHRSFWIDGTYGSGKSHAGAVIQHLLSDTIEEVSDYVNQEFSGPDKALLRQDILSLRDSKRLLPVHMYGQQKISQESDLSLQLQCQVKEALKREKIVIEDVKTDFDNYMAHIEQKPELWRIIIENSPRLKSVAPDTDKLCQELSNNNTEVLNRVREAESQNGVQIRLNLTNLQQWLLDVQNKLKESKVHNGSGYDGLLIVWDEYTVLMQSAVGNGLLDQIQEIVEIFSNKENDSYFLFITHPSAFNGLDAEKAKHTKGRYHYIHYNMETVSAFKIMSRKFKTVNPDGIEYSELYNNFYADKQSLLEMFSASSNNPEDTKNDLKRVFPLHPYTANLATFYARVVGSSSRSVFQFLACDAVRGFLDDDEKFFQRATITADMLWDYVCGDFEQDGLRFAAVTERYNTYRLNVEHEGELVNAVFKSILLLNALNNIAQNPTVTPSEDNIRNVFNGTPYQDGVDDAMNYLNEKSIIQKNPMGLFSIQFSALPTGEVQKKKEELLLSQFQYTMQVVKFGDAAQKEMERMLKNVARPYTMEFYSEYTNESSLLNMVENGYKKSRTYDVFLAFFFAKTAEELNHIKGYIEKAAKDERFHNVCFVVFDTLLGAQGYERFVDYMAIASVAQQRGMAEQFNANIKDASDLITDWLGKIKRGNLTYYLRESTDVASASKLTSLVNNAVGPIIFSSGPESLPLILSRYSNTYWKKASVKATVDAVLSYNTKEEIVAKCGGPAKHIEFLLQDSVNDDLSFKEDVDQNHPLVKVCQRVKSIFDHTNKNVPFNLADKLEEFTKPPYGFFQSYAPMGMVAFALRPYIKQLFDMNGKPREVQHMVDDVVDVFKSWEEQKPNAKLTFQFESKESGELCKKFKNAFNLDELPGYDNISSLKDARWAITHEFATKVGFPLWALKHIDCKDDVKKLIDNILKICEPEGLKNPALLAETLQMMKLLLLDLKSILKVDTKFRDGFVNFLKEVAEAESIDMDEESLEDAIAFIRQHQEGEVGVWSEEDVSKNLLRWDHQRLKGDNKELCSLLIDTFSLDSGVITSQPTVEEILDLIREFVIEKMEVPLWALKYSTTGEGIHKLLDSLQILLEPGAVDNPANCEDAVTRLREYGGALKYVLDDADNFDRGLTTFMQGLQNVKITPEEYREAEDYLYTKLPDVNQWTELSVSNALKDWRLEQSHKAKPVVEPEQREKIRGAVSKLWPNKAKNILVSLCDESDEILKAIEKYVS